MVYRNKKYLHVLYSLVPVLFILLYLNFNENRTGVKHFSSIQKINLIDYNIGYYLISEKGEEYADSVVSQIKEEANNIDAYAENYQFTMEKGKKIIQENFFSYTYYHLKGSWRFFVDPGRFDLSVFFGLEKTEGKGIFHHLNTSGWAAALQFLFSQNLILLFSLVFIFLFNLLKIIGLLFFGRNSNIPLEIRIFVLLLLLYFAGVTGSIAASRFMVPMLPILIGVVSMEVGILYSKLTQTR